MTRGLHFCHVADEEGKGGGSVESVGWFVSVASAQLRSTTVLNIRARNYV